MPLAAKIQCLKPPELVPSPHCSPESGEMELLVKGSLRHDGEGTSALSCRITLYPLLAVVIWSCERSAFK
jgi:hypothetical protein